LRIAYRRVPSSLAGDEENAVSKKSKDPAIQAVERYRSAMAAASAAFVARDDERCDALVIEVQSALDRLVSTRPTTWQGVAAVLAAIDDGDCAISPFADDGREQLVILIGHLRRTADELLLPTAGVASPLP
jgi:hypothetical protein